MENNAAKPVAQHKAAPKGALLRVGVCSAVPRERERGGYEVVELPAKYWDVPLKDIKEKVKAMINRSLRDAGLAEDASFQVVVLSRQLARLDSVDTAADYGLNVGELSKGKDPDVWMTLPPDIYAAYTAAVGPPPPAAGATVGVDSGAEDGATASCAGTGAVPSPSMPLVSDGIDAMAASQAEPQPSQPCAFDPTKVYDVFLCHSGSEKHGIVSTIKSALERHGLTNFLDVESLVMGQTADETIRPAMRAAKAIVMVVSIDFLERPYCMGKEARWVVEDNLRLKTIPVFYNVSRRECSGEMSERVRQRLAKGGEETAVWTKTLEALAKMGNIDKLDDTVRLTDALLVEEVVKHVRKNLGHGNLPLQPHVVDSRNNGRVQRFYDLLKTGGNCGLWGQGGIGKTTLARAVFNKLKDSLAACKTAAVEVGQDTSDALLLQCGNRLLAQLDLSPVQNLYDIPTKLENLHSPILLLLDDVWNTAQVDALLPGYSRGNLFKAGSVVLCTSRFRKVLLRAFQEGECHEVEVLSFEEANGLLRWHVFGSTEVPPPAALQDVELQVLEACAGLPLALEVVGSYISSIKRCHMYEEATWKGVLNALKENREEVDGGSKLEGLLTLTLSALNKQCRDMFLDVACILDGYPKHAILAMWEGAYVHEEACTVHQWLEQLLGSSLVREEEASEDRRHMGSILVVHDVLRDLGKQKVKADADRDPSKLRWLMGSTLGAQECVAQGKVSPELRALQLAGYPQKFSKDSAPIQLTRELKVLILQNSDVQPWLQPLMQCACTLPWLDLSFATFQDIPLVVLEMTNLRVLDLSGCKQLTEVPNTVGNLTNLRCLLLRENDMLSSITESISQLINLQTLDLSGCEQLSTIPDGLGRLIKLERLCLNRCIRLQTLPEGISSLSSLQTLKLSKCERLQTLPEGISSLSSLQTMDLYACKQLQTLPEGISGLSSLQTLELSECEQLQTLPEGISGLSSLQTLELSECEQLQTLPEGISGLSSLEEVLAAREELLGPKRPYTLRAKGNLASTLKQLGELQQARVLEEEVLAAREELLGPKHPDTVRAKGNLASGRRGQNFAPPSDSKAQLQVEAPSPARRERLEGYAERQLPKSHESCRTTLAIEPASAPEPTVDLTRQSNQQVTSALPKPQACGNLAAGPKDDTGLPHATQPARQQETNDGMARQGPSYTKLVAGPHLRTSLNKQQELLKIRLHGQLQLPGPDHPDTLSTKLELAGVLKQLGRLHEAQQLQEEVLQVQSRTLGGTHRDTLHSNCSLAMTLIHLGELPDARKMLEQVLAVQIKELGALDLDTLCTKYYLALALMHLGELKQARTLQEEVLEAQFHILPKDDLDTLSTKDNLAVTLQKLGELQTAKALQEEVLELREESDPQALQTMHNLAITLRKLGELQRARQLQEMVAEARVQANPKDVDALRTKDELAITLLELGDPQQAYWVQKEVVEVREEVLGKEHTDTLLSKSNMAHSLLELSKVQQALDKLQHARQLREDARQLQDEVLQGLEHVLGKTHPDTLRTRYYLAITLLELGEVGLARKHQEEVLKERTALLGAKHPDTSSTRQSLASICMAVKDFKQAKELQEEVVKFQTEVLGQSHPGTLQAQQILASILSQLREVEQARDLLGDVLRKTAALEANHVITLNTKEMLAAQHLLLKDLHIAKQLAEEVVKGRVLGLGAKHRDTLKAKEQLRIILDELGLHAEAQKLDLEVIQGSKAATATRETQADKDDTARILSHLTCPLTKNMFDDPVFLVQSGRTYSRAAILEYLQGKSNPSDPVTPHQILDVAKLELRPNYAVKQAVNHYKNQGSAAVTNDEPHGFICPLSHELMNEPVMLIETAHTYEHTWILQSLAASNRLADPVNNLELKDLPPRLEPNKELQAAIQEYKQVFKITDVGEQPPGLVASVEEPTPFPAKSAQPGAPPAGRPADPQRSGQVEDAGPSRALLPVVQDPLVDAIMAATIDTEDGDPRSSYSDCPIEKCKQVMHKPITAPSEWRSPLPQNVPQPGPHAFQPPTQLQPTLDTAAGREAVSSVDLPEGVDLEEPRMLGLPYAGAAVQQVADAAEQPCDPVASGKDATPSTKNPMQPGAPPADHPAEPHASQQAVLAQQQPDAMTSSIKNAPLEEWIAGLGIQEELAESEAEFLEVEEELRAWADNDDDVRVIGLDALYLLRPSIVGMILESENVFQLCELPDGVCLAKQCTVMALDQFCHVLQDTSSLDETGGASTVLDVDNRKGDGSSDCVTTAVSPASAATAGQTDTAIAVPAVAPSKSEAATAGQADTIIAVPTVSPSRSEAATAAEGAGPKIFVASRNAGTRTSTTQPASRSVILSSWSGQRNSSSLPANSNIPSNSAGAGDQPAPIVTQSESESSSDSEQPCVCRHAPVEHNLVVQNLTQLSPARLHVPPDQDPSTNPQAVVSWKKGLKFAGNRHYEISVKYTGNRADKPADVELRLSFCACLHAGRHGVDKWRFNVKKICAQAPDTGCPVEEATPATTSTTSATTPSSSRRPWPSCLAPAASFGSASGSSSDRSGMARSSHHDTKAAKHAWSVFARRKEPDTDAATTIGPAKVSLHFSVFGKQDENNREAKLYYMNWPNIGSDVEQEISAAKVVRYDIMFQNRKWTLAPDIQVGTNTRVKMGEVSSEGTVQNMAKPEDGLKTITAWKHVAIEDTKRQLILLRKFENTYLTANGDDIPILQYHMNDQGKDGPHKPVQLEGEMSADEVLVLQIACEVQALQVRETAHVVKKRLRVFDVEKWWKSDASFEMELQADLPSAPPAQASGMDAGGPSSGPGGGIINWFGWGPVRHRS